MLEFPTTIYYLHGYLYFSHEKIENEKTTFPQYILLVFIRVRFQFILLLLFNFILDTVLGITEVGIPLGVRQHGICVCAVRMNGEYGHSVFAPPDLGPALQTVCLVSIV